MIINIRPSIVMLEQYSTIYATEFITDYLFRRHTYLPNGIIFRWAARSYPLKLLPSIVVVRRGIEIDLRRLHEFQHDWILFSPNLTADPFLI